MLLVYAIGSLTVGMLCISLGDMTNITFIQFVKLLVFYPVYLAIAAGVVAKYGLDCMSNPERSIKEYMADALGTGTVRKIFEFIF